MISLAMSVKRLFAIVMLVALAAAACGVPTDEMPRTLSLEQISQELRPGQLPTPTPEPEVLLGDVETGRRQIHMISPGNQLEIVERQVADTPEGLLRILMNGTTPEEADRNITSAFDTRDSSATIHDVDELMQLVTVDLAPGSLDSRNTEQKLGFAQIVFTLTSLPGIEFVDFIESNPDDPDNPTSLAVQTDERTTLPGDRVSRLDFRSLDPNLGPEPAFDIPTPVPTVQVIDTSGLAPVTVWEIRQILRDFSGSEILLSEDDFEGAEIIIDEQLVGVVRLAEPTVDGTLASLFSGVQFADRSRGLRTALPPDAFVNSTMVSAFNVTGVDETGIATVESVNIAVIDLALGSLPSESDVEERLLAIAQIVFTVTGLEEVDAVAFLQNGAPISVPIDDGMSVPFDPENPVGLTRSDFALRARGSFVSPVDLEVTPDSADELTAESGDLDPGDDATSDTQTDDDPATPTPSPTPTPGG